VYTPRECVPARAGQPQDLSALPLQYLAGVPTEYRFPFQRLPCHAQDHCARQVAGYQTAQGWRIRIYEGNTITTFLGSKMLQLLLDANAVLENHPWFITQGPSALGAVAAGSSHVLVLLFY
jgi:hypothetical protein